MTAPWFIAERRSYDTMLETYDREAYASDNRRTSGGVIRSAVRNGLIPDRIAITHFLLDEGLDPLMLGAGTTSTSSIPPSAMEPTATSPPKHPC